MTRSIRKKILTAFFAVIFIFLTIVALTAVYNQSAYYKSQKKVEIISLEMEKLGRLDSAINRLLMSTNDYIITGDRRYEGDFKKESEAIERLLRETEGSLALSEGENAHEVEEEREILRDVRVSLINISAISARIFALQRPAGSAAASRLMEEMDYKWGRHAITRLERWHEIEAEQLKDAVKLIQASRRRSWSLMGAAFVLLTGGGVFFASYYSKRFVGPIRELHNGADRIAAGDLDFRVDVRTGDEVEQLARHFNVMGERLKGSYSMLEERVRERTKELQYERDKLLNVFNTMVDGVCIVNKGYDIEYVNPVLEREFGPCGKKKCYEYFHDRAGVCPLCPNQEVFAGKTVRSEWRSSKNNRTYDLIDTPLRNPDGSVSKLEIFRDITEKKRTEEELKARLNDLERFRAATVGRESRMKELRDELKALREKTRTMEKKG